ncbi:ABC transporter substrate-binding protein [Halodurantibacterium flavum]|uniref:Probable sugar-binding periplasmic protein n=1 Tax=Halodurantibacterium flavum TaxID=1382802 RepID=A0ABW4S247_9RHOB
MKRYPYGLCVAALSLPFATSATAANLEITHWWTSGGEAAAASEVARLFEERNTGHTWVDGALAGGSGIARPIIISRILGGDPMAATQLNHGRQAEELVEAGLMLDLTELAEAEGWRDIVQPVSLLDACTVEGRVYCVPLNIHSWQWLWLSHQAFEDAGLEVPTNWNEFVAAAPALREAGKIPLAMGMQPWQANGTFSVMASAIGGLDAWTRVYVDKDADTARGPEFAAVFEAADTARQMSAGTNVQDWNQATNMVITGTAGGQVMGDWAQGEFAMAGLVAGEDYTCLPGLGVNEIISTGGDAIYFPVNRDPAVQEGQFALASHLISPEVQVAFNLRKGSLPVRGDIDMAAANDCMQRGLEILARGDTLPDLAMIITPDTQAQIEDLMVEFWNDSSMTPEAAQERFADIIASAD